MRIARFATRRGKLPGELGPVVGIHVARTAVRMAEFDRRKQLIRLLELPPGSASKEATRVGVSFRLFAPWGFAVLSTQEALFRNMGDVPECGREMLTGQLEELSKSMGGSEKLVGDLFMVPPCGGRRLHGCLALARESAVKRGLELIGRAGAMPGGVGLEMLALFRLWLRAEPPLCHEQIGLAHADGCGVSVALFDRASPIGMRHVLCDGRPVSRAAVESFIEALAADAGWSRQPRILVTGDERLSCGATPMGALALSPALSGPGNEPLLQRCMPAIAAAIAR